MSLSSLPSMNSRLIEIRQQHPLKNPYREVRERLSGYERFAVWIANNVGTTGFFLVVGGWTLLWVGWNFFGSL